VHTLPLTAINANLDPYTLITYGKIYPPSIAIICSVTTQKTHENPDGVLQKAICVFEADQLQEFSYEYIPNLHRHIPKYLCEVARKSKKSYRQYHGYYKLEWASVAGPILNGFTPEVCDAIIYNQATPEQKAVVEWMMKAAEGAGSYTLVFPKLWNDKYEKQALEPMRRMLVRVDRGMPAPEAWQLTFGGTNNVEDVEMVKEDGMNGDEVEING
jgi:hypothetical protein